MVALQSTRNVVDTALGRQLVRSISLGPTGSLTEPQIRQQDGHLDAEDDGVIEDFYADG